MSRPKRTVSSWLQSSFDVDEHCEFVPNKKTTYQAIKDEKLEDFDSFNTSVSYKKKPCHNLAALLAACAPKKPAELAISRQKQGEISKWFQEKVKHGQPSLLVISGPSGCGKTEAFKVIAKDNKFDVVEWITPMDQIIDENNRIMRQGERFEDFLIRATRYSSVLSDYSRRLLLVKDIPNCYIEGKDDFAGLLRKYCQYGREPLVFINTDTGSSKLMMTLFSQSNRDYFKIDLININACTPTALKNVMKRVSTTLNSKAKDILRVTQQQIDEVLSNNIGDVRSALLNLIFCSLKVQHTHESECTVREETLGLLHAIGRVINPKKVAEKKFLQFVHNPDELASCFQTQANTFINFVHENYLNTLGCNVDGAAMAIDVISLADVFNSEWRNHHMTKLALSHCVRGVMIAIDKPVPNWNPVRKPANSINNLQRNFALAEVEWYERYINPKVKKPIDIELSESIIEEISDW
ncbi:cell cycle checkpoint protein RAD17-like [Copidosoma floridanum]|uniref:cell cycle checkpoint protein RAD17 n=1 Tax=Copidosoma floridanum TaxID=29053 RepID=UPI0006C9D7D6|nr:cell cycle checkpoint protein RAD17 [Copidosoma floridanum]XP_023245566.1 cell cycle checkpoint protein RAD17-like [Copidosoma floridanum]